MRRYRLIAAALLLALPIGGALWLLYTESGLRWIVRQLDRFEQLSIKIEGASGSIAGPLRVRRFELDHPRVHVIVRDVYVDYSISGQFLLTIDARRVRGRQVFVQVRRVPPTPDSGRAPRFLPHFMQLRARNVVFENVRYVNFNGLTLDADRLVADRVRLTPANLSVEKFDVRGPLFDARGNYSLHSQRPLRMAGDAHGTLRSPRGVPLLLDVKLAGTLDELSAEAQLQSPDIANVRVSLTRPNDSWRLAGRVAAPAIGLESVFENAPLRFTDVALGFELAPEGMQAEADLSIPGVGPLHANLTGQFADKRLTIQQADIRHRTAAARIVASGFVQFGSESPVIDAHAQWTQLHYPLTQTPVIRSSQGELRIQGGMPYTFRIAGDLGGENVPEAALEAQGLLSKEVLRLDSYAIRALNGSLTGAGQLAFAKPQQWKLSAAAAQLDPASMHAEFPGQVSFVANAEGRGLNRNALFKLDLRQLRGRLRGERIGGRASVERLRDGWRLHDVNARWSNTRVVATGRIGKELDIQWSIRSRSLQKFRADLGGRFESTGRATGSLKAPHVIAKVSGSNLRYGEWRIGGLDLEGDVDASSDRPSQLTLHARSVGRENTWLTDLRLAASGNRSAHDISIALTGAGSERAQLRIAGQYADPVWTTELREATATIGQRAIALTQAARIVVAPQQATVEPLCFGIDDGRLCGEGWWRRGAWSAQAQIDALPLATLIAQRNADQRLSGTVSGQVRAGADGVAPWRAEANVQVNDAAVHYRLADGSNDTIQIGSGSMAAAATPTEFALRVDLRALANTFVRGEAHIARTGGAFSKLPLQGMIQARTADANLLPLLIPEIDRAAGSLEADVKLGGLLGRPQIDGRIALHDGELDSYRVNLALRELAATAQLLGTGVAFNASAKAGDGTLHASGRFEWQGPEPHGTLRLSGKDLLVADLPTYRVVASPDLTFTLAGKRMNVTGTVLIPSARIQPADVSGAVRVSDDARVIDEHAAEREGRLFVTSTIRTIIGDDVRLETFGLQGRLQGEVTTILRTGETPLGRGELRVEEGRYDAYGQKLEITRGRLLLDNTSLNDPALDIQAERKLKEIKVGLNVRGTLQAPRLYFFSEPSMPQTQIVEYLLVGRSLDDFQNRYAQGTGSTGSVLALQGGGVLASQLGRRLGLEEVGVQSDDNNGAALVLGKFLSPRLFVSYGISLAEAINTLKMRYTISKHWLLRAESGEAHAADLEFTIER